jgi:hypothetical protein
MNKRNIEMHPVAGSEDINVSERANEPNEHRSSSGLFCWYFAQPAMPGLKYALTINGYAILS